MATRESPFDLNALTAQQPDSDDPAYLRYVEEKIRQGRDDIKSGKTFTENEIWEALGVEH